MHVKPLWTNQFACRKSSSLVDTLVVHSMYHPEANDCFSPQLCQEWLNHCGVSAHYLIDRLGNVWQTVLERDLAWHAGKSQMPFDHDQREEVNEFSVGVELLASEISGIEASQYKSLAHLVVDIRARHPLACVLGHDHIAPSRKTDPWLFSWTLFHEALNSVGISSCISSARSGLLLLD